MSVWVLSAFGIISFFCGYMAAKTIYKADLKLSFKIHSAFLRGLGVTPNDLDDMMSKANPSLALPQIIYDFGKQVRRRYEEGGNKVSTEGRQGFRNDSVQLVGNNSTTNNSRQP